LVYLPVETLSEVNRKILQRLVWYYRLFYLSLYYKESNKTTTYIIEKLNKTTDNIIVKMNEKAQLKMDKLKKACNFTLEDWEKNPKRTTIIIKNVNKTINGTYTIESQGEFGNGSFYMIKDVSKETQFWNNNPSSEERKGKCHGSWQVWFQRKYEPYLDIAYYSDKNYMNKTLRQDQFELL
jgi:hypothetical protein